MGVGARALQRVSRQVSAEVVRLALYISIALTLGELLAITFLKAIGGNAVWNELERWENELAISLFDLGHRIPETLLKEGVFQATAWLLFQLIVLVWLSVRLRRFIFTSEIRRRFHSDVLNLADDYRVKQKATLVLYRRYTSYIVKALNLTTHRLLRGQERKDRREVAKMVSGNVSNAVSDYRNMMNDYIIASQHQAQGFHRDLKEAMYAFERRSAIPSTPRRRTRVTAGDAIHFDFWKALEDAEMEQSPLRRERRRRTLLLLGIIVSFGYLTQYFVGIVFGFHFIRQSFVETSASVVAALVFVVVGVIYVRTYHYGQFRSQFRKGLSLSVRDDQAEGALENLIQDTSDGSTTASKIDSAAGAEVVRSRFSEILKQPTLESMANNPMFADPPGINQEISLIETRSPHEPGEGISTHPLDPPSTIETEPPPQPLPRITEESSDPPQPPSPQRTRQAAGHASRFGHSL